MEEVNSKLHAKYLAFGVFEALHEFYSLQCPGGRNAAGVVTSSLQERGRWRRRREFIPGVGSLCNN